MNDFEKLLKNISPDVLKKLQGFAQSSDGQKMLEKFKGIDKEELLYKVSTMTDEDKRKLTESLNKTPDIINKLKGMN